MCKHILKLLLCMCHNFSRKKSNYKQGEIAVPISTEMKPNMYFINKPIPLTLV